MEINREELTKELTALAEKAGMCSEGMLLFTTDANKELSSLLIYKMSPQDMFVLFREMLARLAEGAPTIDESSAIEEHLVLLWRSVLADAVIQKVMH